MFKPMTESITPCSSSAVLKLSPKQALDGPGDWEVTSRMPPVPRRRSVFLIPTFHSLCSRCREKNGSAQSLLSWRLQAGEEVSHHSSYAYLSAPHPPSIPCAGMPRLGLCRARFCRAWPSLGLCQQGATEGVRRRRGDLLLSVRWQLLCESPSTVPPAHPTGMRPSCNNSWIPFALFPVDADPASSHPS